MKKKLLFTALAALTLSLASCGGGEPAIDQNNPQSLAFYPTDEGTYLVAQGESKLLSHIEIPSTYKGKKVTGIMEQGFDGSKVKSVVISEGVASIDARAFHGCTSLVSIVMPSSIASIGRDIFNGCTHTYLRDGEIISEWSLIHIFYKGSSSDWAAVNIIEDSYFLSQFLYFYSEATPSQAGNYWHYINGAPTAWENA